MRGLSTFAVDKLTCRYEKQLGSAHKEICTFRQDAMKYFENETEKGRNEDSNGIIPFPFTNYFSTDFVELAESERPAIVFAKQLKQRLEGKIAWELVRLEYPATLLQYKPATKSSSDDTESTLGESLLEALSRAHYSFKEEAPERVNSALYLLLLGWKPEDPCEESITLICELCNKTVDAAHRQNGEGYTTEEPQPKRPRPSGFNPVHAHRHYCPFVCGFPRYGAPRATPMWQALADKMLATCLSLSTDPPSLCSSEGKSAWVQANELLNAAIVRKQMPADVDSN